MSESGAPKSGLEFPQFEALETAVRRVLRQLEVWRERARSSEAERRRLHERLSELESGERESSGGGLSDEIDRLRSENERLRRQLEDGLRHAERLAREVDFLEDTR